MKRIISILAMCILMLSVSVPETHAQGWSKVVQKGIKLIQGKKPPIKSFNTNRIKNTGRRNVTNSTRKSGSKTKIVDCTNCVNGRVTGFDRYGYWYDLECGACNGKGTRVITVPR